MRGPFGAEVSYSDFDISQWMRQGTCYGISTSVTAVAALTSQVVLFNPVASPIVLHVYMVNVTVFGATEVVASFLSSDPGLTAGPTPINLDAGNTAAAHGVLESQAAAAVSGGPFFLRLVSGAGMFNVLGGSECFRLHNGSGVVFQSQAVNANLEISMWWAEY